MCCSCTVLVRVSPLVAIMVCFAVASLSATSLPAAEPFTYVYDAPADQVVPLSDKALVKKTRWVPIRENDTAHRFKGCAVFMNDKVVAVLGKGSAGGDLYSRQTSGLKLCAQLRPLGRGGADLKQTSLAVKESGRTSVSLDVAFQLAGAERHHVIYTLNVGEPFVKTAATPGVAKLRVQAPCRFAVMPDFFGDDIVVDAAPMSVGRAELPSENFLLHMMPGGQAIVMTVSQSRDNDIGIALSKTQPRRIESSEISYGSKRRIWVAVLADKGIWHERTIREADAGSFLKLDWQMPYPALWRVDWSTVDKLTDSWGMLLQDPKGKYVMQPWFGQDAASGQRFGPEFGPRDWNKPARKRWNPVLGGFTYPCWIDNDRRGYFQPLKSRRYAEGGKVYNFAGPAIVYPIDRVTVAPFSTPIEKLTVVDIVRMTLGVGPCRYILDLEGQKRNSKGVATCYARDVINAIYKNGEQLQKGPVIVEQLGQAVAFIRNVRERIDDYVAFGRKMETYLRQQKRLRPEHAEFFDEMLLIAGRLDEFFDARKASIHTPQYAEKAAAEFRGELLKYTGPDAYGKCEVRMKVFTAIGGSQDGLVASCRMIVKIMRQRSGIAMAMNPALKAVATEIRARTQKILRNPTAYEAPEH